MRGFIRCVVFQPWNQDDFIAKKRPSRNADLKTNPSIQLISRDGEIASIKRHERGCVLRPKDSEVMCFRLARATLKWKGLRVEDPQSSFILQWSVMQPVPAAPPTLLPAKAWELVVFMFLWLADVAANHAKSKLRELAGDCLIWALNHWASLVSTKLCVSSGSGSCCHAGMT